MIVSEDDLIRELGRLEGVGYGVRYAGTMSIKEYDSINSDNVT